MWGCSGLDRIEFKGVGPFLGQRTFEGEMGAHIPEEISGYMYFCASQVCVHGT